MRILKLLSLAAVLAVAHPAWAAPSSLHSGAEEDTPSPAPPAVSSMQARINAANAKVQTGDFAGARIDMTAAIADPQFATLPTPRRHAILTLLALSEALTGYSQSAYEHLTQAGPAAGDATDAAYYFAMSFAAAGHPDQALEAVTWVAEHNPEGFPPFDLGYMSSLADHATQKGDGGASRKRFLEALWNAHYAPPEIYYSAEHLWFHLFEDEVAAGNDNKAKEIAATFVEPDDAIKLRCDKRYARFVATDPKAAVPAVFDAAIERARGLMAAHPTSVEAVHNLASRLADANRLDDALKLTDDALAKVAAAGAKPAYDDQAEKLQWLYMTRGTIMQRLGRRDDNVKAQEAARDSALADGSDPVSQPINLGDEYIAAGRAKEALDAVKDVDGKLSPYGRMAAMNVRACAYSQLGDTAKLADTMAYMKAHISDGFDPFRDAMLCVGDDAGMAQVLVARLDDPLTRNETLYSLQGFLKVPATEFEQKQVATWKKATVRGDVQAAVAKYGSIDHYPMYRPE